MVDFLGLSTILFQPKEENIFARVFLFQLNIALSDICNKPDEILNHGLALIRLQPVYFWITESALKPSTKQRYWRKTGGPWHRCLCRPLT